MVPQKKLLILAANQKTNIRSFAGEAPESFGCLA
jgi:hypothetical protein